MADNVTVDNGTLTDFDAATDEVAVNGGTTAHVQFVKLADGRANGTDGLPGDTSGLWVRPRFDQLTVAVTSAGLTNAIYAAGDQMGNLYTVANAARVSGGTGRITAVSIVDAIDNLGAVDVVFFDRSVTLAADNAAFAISDADALFMVQGPIPLQAVDIGNNRVAYANNICIPYTCNATSLFAAVIARTANAAISSATAHTLRVTVERD